MKERYSFRLEKQLIDKLVENFPNTPKAQSVSNAIMHYLNADDSKEINNKTAYSINQFQKNMKNRSLKISTCKIKLLD